AGGPRRGSIAPRTPGRTPSTAPATWRQNLVGSLSPGSSESQAIGRAVRAAQSATSEVLPNPAGAQTSVRPPSGAAFNRSIRRGRTTNPGFTPGTWSFVASRPGAVPEWAGNRVASAIKQRSLGHNCTAGPVVRPGCGSADPEQNEGDQERRG